MRCVDGPRRPRGRSGTAARARRPSRRAARGSRAPCAPCTDARAGRAPAGGASSPPTTSPRPCPAPGRGSIPAARPSCVLRHFLFCDRSSLEPAVLPDLPVDLARGDQVVVPPRATMRPCSSTTISSARAIVERRWAMITVVRPRIASRRPMRISASVVASTEAVASSRIRMRGSTTRARAIASRWR